jgi:hypothetical protein
MSDREFENYLSFLSGLLRLDSKQRGAIAAELRSHLEDRLEELMEEGVAREEAVRQALAEFGDAAGLAGQFAAISQRRKRRWLMRVTTFSMAAIVLFAAGLAMMWPGRNAGPGVAAVIAQAPEADSRVAATSKTEVPEEASLQEKLNKRIDFKVVEMPLRNVFTLLQDNTGIQFVLKIKKLDEANIPSDTPVTKSLRKVRVGTLLDLILGDLDLAYMERDGLILITTPDEAENQMLIRVYDCRDLLTMSSPSSALGSRPVSATIPAPPTVQPGTRTIINPADSRPSVPLAASSVQPSSEAVADPFGAPATTADPFAPSNRAPAAGGSAGRRQAPTPDSEVERRARELTTLVTTIVDPNSWTVSGGPGSIYSYSGLVVVAQTEQTHKKAERLFDMLREAAGVEVPKEGKVVR